MQKENYRLKRDERMSICKSITDKGQIFADEIYPLYREAIFEKKYALMGFQETEFGATFELWDANYRYLTSVPKAEIAKDGIYLFTLTHKGVEHILYCGISGTSVAYRIYRWFKEYFGKSRYDEGHPAALAFRGWLEEKGIDKVGTITMYHTGILFDNKLNKKETYNFLTELKKMFIMEFEPLMNTQFVNETIDRESME